MADDDEFEPKLGRQRSGGGKRARRYLGRVIAAANLARGGPFRARGAKAYSGARHGRGAGVGRLLATRGGGHRRVIVKASIVRLAGKGAGAAAAHLRYLQRDGVTREGEPGTLYDRESDTVDAGPFRQRGQEDRHQFRFIVSAEDGDQYDDLKPLTRRLMAQLEIDLGTKLDWVAVDHFNTGHPHTHVVVRGYDDRGKDLVIARDYLTRGIRERAAELADLDLGPPTERELTARLRREVDAERLTSIDRALLKDAGRLGEVDAAHADHSEQSLRAGRLAKLARMGLAESLSRGRYRLAEGLEQTLKRMGERGDIVRSMQRAITERGLDRATADQVIFEPDRSGGDRLVGRVILRGLADEAADRHYLIVDGVDGRTHYVDIGQGVETDFVAEGSIIAVTSRVASVRAADRVIAEIASRHAGAYDVDTHLASDRSASEEFAAAHVRRLEAARRGGVGVERSSAGRWSIPADYLDRIERWETRRLRDRPVDIETLSARPLEQLIAADAATWLDRDLESGGALVVRASGFGQEIGEAREARRRWLVAQGLAEVDEGSVRLHAGALSVLRQREFLRAAATLSGELGKPFVDGRPGDRIDGVLKRRIDLISGRFALVERSHDFTLVPWRPALEQARGKPVSGLMREQGVSWSWQRGRPGPSIS